VALPLTMSPGSRIIWTAPFQPPIQQLFSGAGPVSVPSPQVPGPAPIPTGNAGQAPPYPGMVGTGPFVGLCQSVGGAAPDFIGSTAIVFDGAGAPFRVQLGVNTTTWASNGSPPTQAHWSFIDLSA
jgi:hypothetical protein